MDNFRLIAPGISRLLHVFEHKNWNTSPSTPELDAAMGQIFDALEDLALLKNNSEAKQIWLRIPCGTIQDYGDFEELKDVKYPAPKGTGLEIGEAILRWIVRYP